MYKFCTESLQLQTNIGMNRGFFFLLSQLRGAGTTHSPLVRELFGEVGKPLVRELTYGKVAHLSVRNGVCLGSKLGRQVRTDASNH